MDFQLSRSQVEIQKAVRQFAKGEFDKEQALEFDKRREFPVTIWKKAAALGLIGIHFDEKYAGQGLGVLENVIIAEALCTRDSTIGSALMLAGYASECLLRFAGEDIKQRLLPEVAEGRMLSAGAFTELDQGSDMTIMNTTAVCDGNEWIVNGTKTFVINGGAAGFYIVLCQTEAPAGRGLSMILVEADRSGVSSVDIGDKIGLHLVPMADLCFKDVRVPQAHIIGNPGKGFGQMTAFLAENRIVIAAMAVGMAQGAFDRALTHVKQREQFGRKIADFQIIRHKLADMATRIELARLITYQAAWYFDTGDIDPKRSAMAKMAATHAAVEVANEAIQLLGGYGYMVEYEVERFYRDARMTGMLAGARTVQKDAIAAIILEKH